MIDVAPREQQRDWHGMFVVQERNTASEYIEGRSLHQGPMYPLRFVPEVKSESDTDTESHPLHNPLTSLQPIFGIHTLVSKV
jgi:hypothetical protein